MWRQSRTWVRIRRLTVRFSACLIFACLAAGPFVMKLAAQNYLTSTGSPSFSAPYPAEMGTVDAASGNLHLEIPVGTFPQRATAGSLAPKLVYDSHIWVPQGDGLTATWTILGLGMGISAPRTYGTWGLEVGNSSTLIATSDQYKPATGTPTFCETDYLLWDTTGTQHYFPLVNSNPAKCPWGDGTAYAADSSGFYLVRSGCASSPCTINAYSPDGTLVFNYYEGYAQGVNPNYPYMVVEDANGNYLYSNNAIETDTLGRAVGTTMVNGYSTPPPTTLPVFNSQDTTSGTSSYTLTTATIAVKTNFQQSGITECTSSSCTAEVIQSILLPDNSKYTFLYDCDSTTGNSACGSPGGQSGYYGTVTSMTLPTGQTITYGYSNFKDASGNTNRWITSKTTTSSGGGNNNSLAPAGAVVWSYTPSVTANGGWKTSYSCATGVSVDGCQQTTVARPDSSKEVTVFALNNGAWPMTVTSYDTNGTTVLSTVTNAWDFSNPCTLAACDNGGATQEFGAQYIRRTNTWTTAPVPGGSITKKTSYIYDTPQTANVAAIQEWAFRSGTQSTASFPTVPDRATYAVYTSIGTNNNINRPASVTVCNSAGTTDSNCAVGGKIVGGTTVSRTTIAYDTYGAKNSGGQQVVLPLQSVSGAVNHDDTNFGSSYTPRGNATQISRLVSGSTYLTTYVSYDTTGQTIQVLDSNLNKTTYSYADRYFYDNGGDPYNSVGSGPPTYAPATTNAYPTTVTDPIGTTAKGYYYGSGKAALATDYNGVTSYAHYMDPFDRGTETDSPIGWNLDIYTLSPNPSLQHYQAVGDAIPSTSCISCTQTYLAVDSLGRETSAAVINNPAGQTTVSSTYDSMSRTATVSHPNFGTSDPNDVVETQHYDGLSRSLGVTHPDGEATKTAYGAAVTALGGLSAEKNSAYGVGFPVVSVDEQGNLRQRWLDGFGRVIEVDEPSGAGGLTSPNYTNYSYDVLGSLTSVVQGAQTRTYAYDGLSRLTQEFTPEAGTFKYSYVVTGTTLCSGDPSNVCSRTDARGIVTNYSYDTGNRLKAVAHVPTTTGAEGYTYGTSASAYNIGRLLTMTDPSGSETYTYDTIGRVIQVAKTVGSTIYTLKYAYNSGGQLAQITYPSGRSVYYNYDNVGHLCVVDVSVDTNCTPSSAPYLIIPIGKYDAAGHALSAKYGNGMLVAATYYSLRSQLATLNYGSHPASSASSSVNVTIPVCGGIPRTCSSETGIFAVTSSAGFNVGDTVTVTGNSNSSLDGTFLVSSIPNGTTVDLTMTGGVAGQSGTGGTLTDNNSPGSPVLLGLNYYYQQDSTNCPGGNSSGNNGQVQCIKDVSTAVAGDSGRSVSYSYDYLGRLSGGSTAGSTNYPAWTLSETYDRYGNLSKQSGSTNIPPVSLTISPANNRITTSGYAYDTGGNLTATPNPGGTSYVYDGEECLTNYSSATNSATYTCDGNGVRVKKVVTGANAVTTVAIYSGSRVIAEYDNGAAVTSPTREYIYGNNLLATVTGSTGGTGGTIVYQHRDHLSPRLYTSSTGADLGEEGTFPFGEPWYSNGTTSNWVFTSYERDAESGNDNAMARSYASSQARFLSPDPSQGNPSNPQSWNRYSYVGNDPINVTDPSGKFWLFDVIELVAAYFTDDPALAESALADAATDPNNYVVTAEIIGWGAVASGAGAAAGLGEAAALGAGSAGAGAFVWGGPNDPGGALNPTARALFTPNGPYSGYWQASQNFIGATAKSMAVFAATTAMGQPELGLFYAAKQFESPLVPTSGFKGYDVRITGARSAPGTTNFGNEVHQNFGRVLTEQTNTLPGDWIMRTSPGQVGVDAEYVGPAIRNPGFNYAELKPVNYSSYRVGVQIGKWNLPEGETSIWWYNEEGIIGQTEGVW
jgi:RHS repeat-associated protein